MKTANTSYQSPIQGYRTDLIVHYFHVDINHINQLVDFNHV